jgi:protein TonB
MEIKNNLSVPKGIFLSFLIHGFFMAGVLFLMTLETQRPEIVQVSFNIEKPGSEGGGEKVKQVRTEAKKNRPPAKPTYHKQAPIVRNTPEMDRVSIQEEKTPPEPIATQLSEEAPAPVTKAAIGEGGGVGNEEGSGIGSHEGKGKGDLLESLKNRYLREHFAYIRDLILKNLTYPAVAKRFGWQGKLLVSFIVRENGEAERIKILKSSGYAVLDTNVVETIRDVQPFPKPPIKAELIIPIAYVLKF